jgi:hypothetical protein
MGIGWAGKGLKDVLDKVKPVGNIAPNIQAA